MVEPQLATTPTNRESQATDIVIRYANWSTVPGFLPTPVIDIALLTGIQLRMLKKLSDHYDVPFSENLVKSLLMSLIGGIVPTKFGFGYLVYALKAVPVVGNLLSLSYMPAFAWAVTFAVGKVFVQHFESGGTFLSFDPVAAREHFQRILKREHAARAAE